MDRVFDGVSREAVEAEGCVGDTCVCSVSLCCCSEGKGMITTTVGCELVVVGTSVHNEQALFETFQAAINQLHHSRWARV